MFSQIISITLHYLSVMDVYLILASHSQPPVVCDEDNCPSLIIYILEKLHDLISGFTVKRACRLIGKQDIRIVHKVATLCF